MRCALTAVVVSLTLVPAAAQPPLIPAGDKVIIPITISPASIPKPASRYLLQPQYTEIQPGEKLAGFLKCFMEQNVFFNTENSMKREAWNQLPLDELPLDEIKEHGVFNGIAYNPPYAGMMVFMDQAARYDRVEWNIRYNLRKDGWGALLPDVQKLRELASVLKLRMRAEIKAGEFAKAAETSKTLFGLARMLEQHPTLIGYLVGVAIATIAVEALEEMVQQPGCPNWYWGLTELGSPVLDLRLAVQGERTLLSEQYRPLLDATGPISQSELAKYLKQLDTDLAVEFGGKNDTFPATTHYTKLAENAKQVEAARAFLIDWGMKPEHVKTFTPLQVIATYDLRQYEVHRDEYIKLIPLPLWQFRPLAASLEDNLKQLKDDGKLLLAPRMVSSFGKVRQIQARLDQRVAFLRVIEGIRLYAHENGGTLPASLDDIPLPLPLDPVNGLPFVYGVRDNNVVTLHGANPIPDNATTNRHYEIRVQK